jgi:hypothetical protein
MIELNVRHTHQGLGVDLLPWADPYIMQLFLESERLEDRGVSVAASTESGGRSSQAAVAAPLSSDSWGINPTRRPSLPRRRRTESERLLVRC